MKFNLHRYIAKRLARSKTNSNFMNFAQLVSTLSVMIGSLALILSLAILNGFESELRKTATKFTSDIAIYTINGEYINNSDSLKSRLLKLANSNIIVAEPVLYAEGLATSKSFTEGIALQSITSSNYLKTGAIKSIKSNIISGDFNFSSNDAKEIIIGQELARKLSVSVGDKILLYILKNTEVISFSSAVYSQFKIKAIYKTGMIQYDGLVSFLPYETLLNLLELPENTSSYIEVFLSPNVVSDLKKVNNISEYIEDTLGYPFFPLTYHDLNPSMFAWIELQKEPIPLVLAIITIVALLNIITMLIIRVVEKTHTIGILRALGLQNKKIIFIFVFQGVKTAFVGSILGASLALLASFLQNHFGIISLDSDIYFLDKLPIKIEWYYFIIVISATLFFSILASLLPATIACKISPLRSIRFR